MDKKKINRLHAGGMIILGIMMILIGLFGETLPHGLRMAAAVAQILIGCCVLVTSILKIKGKF